MKPLLHVCVLWTVGACCCCFLLLLLLTCFSCLCGCYCVCACVVPGQNTRGMGKEAHTAHHSQLPWRRRKVTLSQNTMQQTMSRVYLRGRVTPHNTSPRASPPAGLTSWLVRGPSQPSNPGRAHHHRTGRTGWVQFHPTTPNRQHQTPYIRAGARRQSRGRPFLPRHAADDVRTAPWSLHTPAANDNKDVRP